MNQVTFKITVLSKASKSKAQPEVLELRKFSLPREGVTVATLAEAYGSMEAVLQYRDAENDLISLRTQADIDEMLRFFGPEQNTLRLQTSQRRDSLVTRVARGGKQVAEEALVLGVRGASWVGAQWKENAPAPAVPETPGAAPEPAKEPMTPDSPDLEPASSSPSLASRAASGARQLAEEALVLGVRGVSYVEHQWTSAGGRDNAPPQADSGLVAPSAPVALPSPAPVLPQPMLPTLPAHPLGDSWVTVHQQEEPAPKPELTPAELHLESLQLELVAMGFADRERNLAALARADNSVEAAVAQLLGEQ